MAQIVTVTINPAIDESTSVEHVRPNQKLRCEPPRFYPGGGGVNVARAIHQLGGEAEAWCTSGGPSGQMLQDLLHQEGVSCRAIPSRDRIRTNVVVWERASDHQYRLGMPGPRLEESEWQQYLDAAREAVPAPPYLVASGSLARGVPDDFYARLAETARKAGSRFIVDTSGEPLRKAVEAGVYLVKPNLRELNHLAGRVLTEERDQERTAVDLVNSGRARVVVVSLGAGGAFLASSEGNIRLRSPTVPIRSRVGAGDSMTAGIVLALSRGRSLKAAANFGVAAGAAAVTTPGTELCRRQETEQLFESLKQEAQS